MSIDQKLDKIVDTLGQQAIILERLTVTVEEHVKRSNLQEEAIKETKQKQEDNLKTTNEKIEPLQRHVWMMKGGLKLIGLLALLACIAEGLAVWLRK